MYLNNKMTVLLLSIVMLAFQSCAAIGGIFKAGVWVGVVAVVVVVLIIVLIASKAAGKK